MAADSAWRPRFSELGKQFRSDHKRFRATSLVHFLVDWPEGSSIPQYLAQLDELWTPIRSWADTPHERYTPGRATVHWLHDTETMGDENKPYPPAYHRFVALAQSATDTLGVSPAHLRPALPHRSDPVERWLLAIHRILQLQRFVWIPTEHPGFGEAVTASNSHHVWTKPQCAGIPDVFLDSADAIQKLLDGKVPPATVQEIPAVDGTKVRSHETNPSCELADRQLFINGEPYRLEPTEYSVLEAIAKHGALPKDELTQKSNVSDAVNVLKAVANRYKALPVRLPGGKGKGGYWASVRLREAPKS